MNSEEDEILCWAADYAEAYVLSGGQTNVTIDSTAEYELVVKSIESASVNWMDDISTQDLVQSGEDAMRILEMDSDDDVVVANQSGGRVDEVSACPACHNIFPTPFALQRHIMFEHNSRRFQCKKCGLILNDTNALFIGEFVIKTDFVNTQ